MTTNKSTLILSALFFCLLTFQKATAQSNNYPSFMQYFWPKDYDSEAKVVITDRLINNTVKGKDYVTKLNSLYREFDQLMENKNLRNKENQNYADRNRQYEKQYNMANATLQLAKANYNACRQNCGHLAQNVNNIINNMNNLSAKINQTNNIINSLNNRLDEMSNKLYSIDREQASLRSELQNYIQENIRNGTISLKK